MRRFLNYLLSALGVIGLLGGSSAIAADLVPLVEGDTGFLIGAKSGDKWLDSLHAGKALKPATKFRVFSLTKELAPATGGKAKPDAEVCPEVYVVPLSPAPEPEQRDAIAIAAPWNPIPRVPKVADPTQEVYRNAVRDYLVGRGLRD